MGAAWIGLIGVVVGGVLGGLLPWWRARVERAEDRRQATVDERRRVGGVLLRTWLDTVITSDVAIRQAFLRAWADWEVWTSDTDGVNMSRALMRVLGAADPMARRGEAGRLAAEVLPVATAWLRESVTPAASLVALVEVGTKYGWDLSKPAPPEGWTDPGADSSTPSKA